MRTQIMHEEELLFEEDVRLTEVKEYGFSWKQFVENKAPLPPEGLSFDIHFEGKVTGDKIEGTIKGVDYLTVRADHRLFLDLRATITTNDGARIKVTETGINEKGHLRLDMDFHTNDKRYKWLNHKHIWGDGTVNFETGQVKIKGFQH